MNKAETVRSLSKPRIEAISKQISELRELQNSSIESLASQIEPLAQSLAALTDESKEMILQIVSTAAQQQKENSEKISSAAQKWSAAAQGLNTERKQLKEATSNLSQAAKQIEQHSRGTSLKMWIAAISTAALITLGLLSGYAIYQPPLSTGEKSAVRYFNAISAADQQRILQMMESQR